MLTWTTLIGIIILILLIVSVNYNIEESKRLLNNKIIYIMDALDKNTEIFDKKISDMQSIIEAQDTLIAALWAKTYGYHPDEDDYLIYAWSEYPVKVFGVQPSWVVMRFEEEPTDGLLSRTENYPWRGSLV